MMSDNVVRFPVSIDQRAKNASPLFQEQIGKGRISESLIDMDLERLVAIPQIKSRINHLESIAIPRAEQAIIDGQQASEGLDISPYTDELKNLKMQLALKVVLLDLLKRKLSLLEEQGEE